MSLYANNGLIISILLPPSTHKVLLGNPSFVVQFDTSPYGEKRRAKISVKLIARSLEENFPKHVGQTNQTMFVHRIGSPPVMCHWIQPHGAQMTGVQAIVKREEARNTPIRPEVILAE